MVYHILQFKLSVIIIIIALLSIIAGISLKISSSVFALDFASALQSADPYALVSDVLSYGAYLVYRHDDNNDNHVNNNNNPQFAAAVELVQTVQDIKNKNQEKTSAARTTIPTPMITKTTKMSTSNVVASAATGEREEEGIKERTGKNEPFIKIVKPVYNSTYITKQINVEGSALILGGGGGGKPDGSSGIKKVEVSYHDNTKNVSFPYQLASPLTQGSWSRWSVKLDLNSTGYYRILARATDINGSQAWDSVIIHVPFFPTGARKAIQPNEVEQSKVNIALVQNTFTESAYTTGGFYSFYSKYDSVPKGQVVTSDLDMLTTEVPREASKKHILTLDKHLKNIMPYATITNIVDQDVHERRIFSNYTRNNEYDILILFHEEYVTLEMYDNFRRFVNNGGTIVFMDADPFIAEVKYDEDRNTVTLVRGHAWDTNGRSAWKSEPERWFNETKEWVGSNFVNRPIAANIYFRNNPFSYKHFEENYANNPHITTLFDYEAQFPDHKVYTNDTKIVAYFLNNGKGKVVMLGIYAEKVLNNKPFLDFFDNVILRHALSPTIPKTPSIKITKPIDYSKLKVMDVSNITVEGTAQNIISDASSPQINTGIKDIQVRLDNSTYYNARPQGPNNWSRWSISFNSSRLGSHEIISRVTDDAGNMNWSLARVFTESVDRFGINKIYQTEQNGRQWYVNMNNPRGDKNFILEDIKPQEQPDGSWRVGSADRQGPFNGKYHIIMGVKTPPHEKEWKNVEITGYARVVSTSDPLNVLQWYARGGNHTSKAPCDGTSLKGRILVNGSVGWKKEIWHDGGYTDQNFSSQATHSILNRWIGWKVVMYNINDTAVKMESYLDAENNNKWRKVTEAIDNGGWYSSSPDSVFYSVNCGKPKDYVVTNSGPVVAFRSDGIVWDFKNLSVREIQPPFPFP